MLVKLSYSTPNCPKQINTDKKYTIQNITGNYLGSLCCLISQGRDGKTMMWRSWMPGWSAPTSCFFLSGFVVYTSPLRFILRSRVNFYFPHESNHNCLDPSRTVEAFIATHLWDAWPEWKTLQQEIGEWSQGLSTLFSVCIHLLDESVVNGIISFCGTLVPQSPQSW